MGVERISLTVSGARELAERSLEKLGYAGADARVVADHLIDAELCGYEYSGLSKILNIAANPRSRRARTPVRIVKETPVSVLVDGGHNVGMLSVHRATERVIAKARGSGMAIACVYDSFNSGRNAYYLEMICNADLVGIHFVSAPPQVTVPGGTRPVLGTNPLAFGAPTLGDPLSFDMATSAVAGSDLMHRQRLRELLPPGVAVDHAGQPTRDPDAARLGGILPFGGHKGFGLSVMVQALGLLAGAASTTVKEYGFVLIAIDPAIFSTSGDFKHAVSALVERLKATPRREREGELRLPSERAFAERKRRLAEDAITVDPLAYERLSAL
jgi:LDH2 family malate/lactate/ureidoglycolate dehydrogenase